MSVLANLLKTAGHKAVNTIDDIATKVLPEYADDVAREARKGLIKTAGYSIADDLPLRHVTSNAGLGVSDLATNRNIANQIHDGVLYMSKKNAALPKLGSGSATKKFFGNGRGLGVLDISDPDAANQLADYIEIAASEASRRGQFPNYNRQLIQAQAGDIRNGITESLNDYSGALKRLLGNDISLIKGTDGTQNAIEYVAANDKTLDRIFGRK